ncbi:hypothetical protein [Methylibium sp.]|uniref:hypothetical protein n=1 Tax=Methylibium sp. TaxID=2067992 RepID=UPI003D0F63E3
MSVADPALSRRRLLQLGAGATVVLAAAGGAAWLWRPGVRDGALTRSGRAVFRAIARVVLEGSLPTEAAALEAALDRHLLRLDETIAGLPAATQGEIAQLLGLLSVAVTRRWLTGLRSDWPEARIDELEAALRRMRTTDHELRQQAYHALRDLTNAAFYAQPEHWPLMGYPGPSPV